MITEIEDYFAKGCGRCARFDTAECSARLWAGGLRHLRAICLEEGLLETVKWGHPCYLHAGRNIALIGAFRGDFRISFFNASLLQDHAGVLERKGPNTQHADMIRFVDSAAVTQMAPLIRAYLAEAAGYARAGIRPAKDTRTADLPEELVEALDGDPELAEGFHALTPGRQKSYVIHLTGTKSAATRMARIARLRGHILAGKGVTER